MSFRVWVVCWLLVVMVMDSLEFLFGGWVSAWIFRLTFWFSTAYLVTLVVRWFWVQLSRPPESHINNRRFWE